MENRMVARPMTSREPERSWPHYV